MCWMQKNDHNEFKNNTDLVIPNLDASEFAQAAHFER